MLQKGIHVHVEGIEISLRPGAGGEIIYKPATAASRAGFSHARAVVEDALANNPRFRENLIRTVTAARDRFASGEVYTEVYA